MDAPPLITGAVCVYPFDAMLARRLTIPSRFEEDTPMLLYTKLSDDFMGLPWHLCPPCADDRRSAGHPIYLKSKVVPKDAEQARCIPEIKAHLRAGRSFITKAPTGSGKTVMSIDAICDHGRTTLVVVPKDDLVDQWVERILQYTDASPAQIGRLQGDECDVEGKAIVIGSLRSLAKMWRYPPWVYSYFGLVVFDEVHRLAADLMSQTIQLFSSKQRLGLSATVKRKDGKDLLLEAHIGPILVEATVMQLVPRVNLVQTGWKCPRRPDGEFAIPHSMGRIALAERSLYNNGDRNGMICRIAAAAVQKGRRTVIFSGQTEHLEMLELFLPRFRVSPHDIGKYYGNTRGPKLAREGQKRIVLATPGKMAEGTDIWQLDTCILGVPISDPEQIVGRILREDPFRDTNPTKQHPVVFDLRDDDSWVLEKYAQGRVKFYTRIKAPMQWVSMQEQPQ